MVHRSVYTIATLTILGSLGLASTRVAAPPSGTQNVMVVNTPTSPVPTSAQGTTQVGGTVAVSSLPAVQLGSGNSVAISNSPTVGIAPNQTVSISGNVTENVAPNQTIGISGEPTVHIDPNDTITVGGNVTETIAPNQTITVGNGPGNPIPVQETEPVREPVDNSGTFVINDGQNSASLQLYTVPLGKRLILQNLSFNATMPTGETIIASLIRDTNVFFAFSIPLSHDGPWGQSLDSYTGALTDTNFAYNAGDQVYVEVQRATAVGGGTFHGAYSGYLQDAP